MRGSASKRILVTGASGFIGRPLVTALLQAGYAVRAVVRRKVSFPDSVDVVIIPDLKNSVDWKPVLEDVNIVIHLAGLAHADGHGTPFGEYDQINWIGTARLANAAKKARIKRFVYISSVRAQVGAFAAQIIRENDAPSPTDHYGRSKLAAEWSIKSLLPCTILRPVVVYGPHAKGNFKTLVRLASLPLPLPFKDYNNRRSILGLDNLISAIMFVLNSQRTLGQTFLVADPNPIMLSEIITILRKAQGRSPWLVYFPKFITRNVLCLLGYSHLWERINNDMVVATTKLESLGWRPSVETYKGLRSALSAENGIRNRQNHKFFFRSFLRDIFCK